MIDKHHAAHYFIAGVIALVGLSGGYKLSTMPPTLINTAHGTRHMADLWTPLSDEQTKALSASLSKLSVGHVDVFCGTPKCDDIANDVEEAATAAGIKATRQVPAIDPPGLSVGARDVLTARAMASAILESTGMKASVATGTYEPFISFGARQ